MSDVTPDEATETASDPAEPSPVLGYGRPDEVPAGNGPRGTAALACAVLFFFSIFLGAAGAPLAVVALLVIGLPIAAVALGLSVEGWRGVFRRPMSYAAAGVWLGGVQLMVLACAVLFAPTIGRPREPANRVKCASNLRQIGLGMAMYANDNGGRLPPDLGTILVTQDLTSEVFVCPSSSDEPARGPTTQAVVADLANPNYYSYVWASPLPVYENALTRDHVVAYEPFSNHDGRGMNVLYGDGHVEWADRTEADHIQAELKAGHNPPRPAGAKP